MKYNTKYILAAIISIFLCFLAIFVLFKVNQGEKMINTSFFLQDPVVTKKFLDDKGYRISVYSKSDPSVATCLGDEYFRHPRDISVLSEDCYNTLLPEIGYTAFWVDIRIPYREAKEKDLILQEKDMAVAQKWGLPVDGMTLNLEKILESVQFIQKYCTLIGVSTYEPDYYQEHYPFKP